jgi:integrase
VRHLKEHFSGAKAINITSSEIQRYIMKRQGEEAENGTINLELAALKRVFTIAARQTPRKVVKRAVYRHAEREQCQDGLLHDGYLRLKDALADYVRPVLTQGYYSGVRVGEILSLQWSQVDMVEGRILLDAGTTRTMKRGLSSFPGNCTRSFLIKKCLEMRNTRNALRFSLLRKERELKIFGDHGRQLPKRPGMKEGFSTTSEGRQLETW